MSTRTAFACPALLAPLLLLLGAVLAACPSGGGGGGGGDDDDDDTTAADDDDDTTAADDDDDTTPTDDDDTTPVPDDDDTTPAPDDDDDSTPSCPPDQVVDCDGGCTDASWLGDAWCDPTLDCAAFGRDGGDCCTVHADCAADAFCSPSGSEPENTCTPVLGTEFIVYVASGTTTTYDANGDTWDTAGGLPDPYAVVTVDDTAVLTTAVVSNSTSAVWAESAYFTSWGTNFCVQVMDEDLTIPDQIDGSCWNGTAGITSIIRSGGNAGLLYNGYASVDFSIYFQDIGL